ncbi:O-acetyl-ADP-ribose deacetylase [Candidatus Poribacteria bacterium]|nr:O-acetyl-ADP-ribose deacetylase [Candidatus Poribacteria bacterium]MXY28186.1 O-acetyl-ADP-ribose deacetylase [Candidatus Poribacteria bacterium]
MTIQIQGINLSLLQGDITKTRVDAIVNAANSQLVGGGGVDGAIRRAGGAEIERACAEIRRRDGGCPTGQAVITPGGNLPARYVIHTVGPVWEGGNLGEPELLASCYRESLRLAIENGIQSIAFPAISTGIYGYPTEKAAVVALMAVKGFVQEENPVALREIQFVLFDEATHTHYVDVMSIFFPN